MAGKLSLVILGTNKAVVVTVANHVEKPGYSAVESAVIM